MMTMATYLSSKSPDALMTLLTNGMAISAVVSPVWLPWLQSTSTYAGYFMPILGVVWLGTQIVRAWTGKDKKK